MILLCVFILFLIIIVNKIVFKKFLCYPTIIAFIWFIDIILTIINPYSMYEIPKNVYKYVAIFLGVFELSSILYYKLGYKIKINDNIKINWSLINFGILFCIIFMIPFFVKGISIYFATHQFSSIRNAYLNYEICSNSMYMFLTLIIIPFGEAIGYYTIINFIKTKKANFSFYMFIVFMVEIIFASGGRARIIYYLVLMIIIILEDSKKIQNLIRKNKKTLFFVLLFLIIVAIITNQRNLQGKGLMYNFYVYLTGGLEILGRYEANPYRYLIKGSNLLNGQVLFSSILYPIYFFLQFFGIELKAGFYVVNEITSLFIPISDITTINNGGTFIYYALRDFGILGIYIYTLLISFVLSHLYKKKKKCSNYYNSAMFYFIFIKCIFLFNEFTLAQTSVLMTFIYFKLLTKRGDVNND